jgi:two-component system chemotaxis response regulator CheY
MAVAQPLQRSIKSILIVDDVKEIQLHLSQVLSSMGFYDIDCAINGQQAFNQLATNQYDLIFLDIELPDYDGKEILDKITYQYPQSQVVMCSGHNTLENVKQTWEMGAKGFVSKPFDQDKVATILKRLQRAG